MAYPSNTCLPSRTLVLRPLGAAVAAVALVSAGLSGFPFHDIMIEPGYWWECLVIQCILCWLNMASLFFKATTGATLNIEEQFTWKNWLITWIFGAVFFGAAWT